MLPVTAWSRPVTAWLNTCGVLNQSLVFALATLVGTGGAMMLALCKLSTVSKLEPAVLIFTVVGAVSVKL